MESLLNNQVKSIEISGIRQFFNMVANYKDVISLTIGQPDFQTPEHVKEAAIDAVNHNHTMYTHNAGLLELRKAVSSFVSTKYGLSFNPESEVITTVGASQAIDITMRTILSEGDEVILPGPVYPGYEPIIKMCGAKAVHVDTTRNGFRMTKDLIEPHITANTKCIIIPYPSNPTGCRLSEEELAEIAEFLLDKNIFVVSDEIYSELAFDGNHKSIAAFPGMKEKTIVINGLSKSHSMTGWRIGFAFAPEYIAKHMLKVHQYNVSCASSISQYAALEALTNGKNDALEMRKEYEKRMEYVFGRLVRMGFEVEKPEGAFYIFPSIKQFNMSSFDFAMKLVEEAGVAVVPGSAFSGLGEGYVRISYAYRMDVLEDGMNRIEELIYKMV
ncbi:aminotransferase A [Pseudalkalibacillus caeni]|uniref:Aminotransferase n=1 Tax=Exobacillus caeni TaxID=2574798 RepID=A0A5R9FCW4_9BACL|nr:aminotransferase A [Pseudalkalibacillus caeni]TLS37485.1 aminotransferase A [Pseudalkalibacillus caeni]